MNKTSGIGSLLVFIAAFAVNNLAISQVSLDAPLVQEKPTLRSEIARGRSASFDCQQGPLELSVLTDCLFKVSSANRQKMGTGYDPFDVGLFFGGWSTCHIASSTLSGHPDFAARARDANEREKITWNTYVALRKKVGLTDDQVIDASGLISDTIRPMVSAASEKFGD
jgi:hypothetical protein